MNEIHFNQLQETLYHEKLENGLNVYVLPKEGFSKTYVTFTTKYGSVDRTFIPRDRKEYVTVPDGIAHFLEHKMFEKEEGDVFQEFSENAAAANAFTSFTRTSYLFSSTSNLYKNTKTLLDFVQQPYFTEKTVEKEKGIIAQEITMYDDQPDWRQYFGTIENLFRNHPVRIDIAGTVETIQDITADHLYECYETFYHPSNMVFFAVGNVDPAEMLKFVKEDQHSKSFKAPEPVVRQFPDEPDEAAETRSDLRMDVTKPKLMIGTKCRNTAMSGKEMLIRELASDVTLDILFGRSSEFYTKAYNEGLIDESFSYEFNLENGFGFAVVGSDTDHPEELEKLIFSVLDEAKSNWSITDGQLDRIRKKRIGLFMRALNSPEYIANQFTHYNFNEMNLFDVVPVLEQLTVEQMKEAFRDLYYENGQTVLTIHPTGNEQG
ncbi:MULTISPECIES: EF-P 5-aminopentanol modification-associated protein YfmH [Sporosarcina]|uniref:EF-P 5-aminopentanol modification-associated protein YfmH n=1 Tax=Sporosarcina TaxID=1569 RepID=UPI00058B5804|nr:MULTISPECIES: pitrilysin family protein [Sporosarcina]WJY28676.1 pitrilysin family protein [Sporosarcina sp. 0.2-SM1T-5]